MERIRKKGISLILLFTLIFVTMGNTALAAEKVRLNKTSVTLSVGESITLTLNGSSIKSAKSSNNKVASVNSKGRVTAKKKGKAIITITGKNKKKYKCRVTVNKTKTKSQLYGAFKKKSKSENEIRFIYDDFDDNGIKEAFGITGDEGEYVIEDVKIYYVSSTGYVKRVAREAYLCGWIDSDGGEIIKTGTDKFLHWRWSAGGSGELSYLFGVKNGKVFEPKISRKYEMFSEASSGKGKFVGYQSVYGENGGQKFKPFYFNYSKKKHQFVSAS